MLRRVTQVVPCAMGSAEVFARHCLAMASRAPSSQAPRGAAGHAECRALDDDTDRGLAMPEYMLSAPVLRKRGLCTWMTVQARHSG